jgi:hypothetical protein
MTISLCSAFLLKSGLTPFFTIFCQCWAVGPLTRQWNFPAFFCLSAGLHREEHSGRGFMLKQISCPSATTLVRCVVQEAGRLEDFDPLLEGFVELVISLDSELELELELELEVELEPDSELERDSDDDDDDDDDDEEDDLDEDDDEEEDEEESLVELSISNPLLLAFLDFCSLITSLKWTLS